MFKFITHRSLFVNILVVVILTALLILVFFGSLDFITKHGQYEKVPAVVGLNIEEARRILEERDFGVEIQDSLYIDTVPKLAVIKQSPEAEANVKVNRTIYLTVNRAQPPLVEMPNLVGFSIRNAQMFLENLGLHMGDTTFRPDIAKNAVLEQLYNGQPIKAGTKIFMGSNISFVLGNGIGDMDMSVPDLLGKQFRDARAILKGLSLNYTPVFDADVIDQDNAYVTRQSPQKFTVLPDGDRKYNRIKPGQTIDIWLGVEPIIMAQDSVDIEEPELEEE